ncbi:MAG TPA: flagellar motor switch protein FliN [Candidatus Acidoferrales bacterium]|nr:flagellar motor switch protein FliN [Candidatus Acidoferrales bacterium]
MSAAANSLYDQWTEVLVEVLQAMADQKPAASWQPGGPPEPAPEQIWWEQPLQIAPDVTVWVAAPRATWEHAGAVTLKAAGLETVELSEARNTYVEILSQSLAGLARSIGSVLGREVVCAAGEERAPVPPPEAGAAVSLKFTDSAVCSLWIGFSPKLVTIVSMPPQSGKPEERAAAKVLPAEEETLNEPPAPPTMDLLLEVELPVSISFGKTALPMRDVLKLTTGSIVELNRGVNEPVEVQVNHCLIARGEVVVVEGNYGVRIQQILSRQDRLRSLR